SGPGPGTGRPSTHTEPPVGTSKPATRRRQVVLPQPDGPTIATNSRSATVRSTRSRAGTPTPLRPNVLVTPSKRITAMAPSRQSVPAHGGFERAQREIDRETDEADRHHGAHHGRGRDVELRLHHHVADAGRGDDQLGADQRLPAQAGRYPQARDD